MQGITLLTSGRVGGGLKQVSSGRLDAEPEAVLDTTPTVGGPVVGPAPLVPRPDGHYPVRSLLKDEALLLVPKLVTLRVARQLRVQRKDDTVILSQFNAGILRKINLSDWECILRILQSPTTINSVAGYSLGLISEDDLRQFLTPDIIECWGDFGSTVSATANLVATAGTYALEHGVRGSANLTGSADITALPEP